MDSWSITLTTGCKATVAYHPSLAGPAGKTPSGDRRHHLLVRRRGPWENGRALGLEVQAYDGNVTVTTALDGALELVAARSASAAQNRRLDDDVIAAITHAGVNRTLLPAELGGRSAHPAELVEAVARVAAADGSTGWCTGITAACNLFSGYLPEDAARHMYLDPDVGIAGMFATTGVVTKTARADGGFDATLTGRWPFTSNCLHSRWIGVGALIRDDQGTEPVPRMVFLSPEDLVIEDTWHSTGLQATGSHHVHADKAHVDLNRSCTFSDRPWADGPLWWMPMFTVFGPVLVAAPLGIARGAIDDVLDIIRTGTGGAMRGNLIDDPVGMAELGAADAALRAAYAGVMSALDEVWAVAESGQRASRSIQARVLLAVQHAIDISVETVSTAHRLCGGGAAYSGHRLLTALHDVHTARQHFLFAHQHRASLARIAAGTDEIFPPFVI